MLQLEEWFAEVGPHALFKLVWGCAAGNCWLYAILVSKLATKCVPEEWEEFIADDNVSMLDVMQMVEFICIDTSVQQGRRCGLIR